jgi:hypothetical protein
MRAVVLPRMGGKTERMLQWLVSDQRNVLIVYSDRERQRLVRLFTQRGEYPSEIDRIVAISTILRGATRGKWREPVYGIDELDLVLAQVVSGPVEIVSFTGGGTERL